MHFDRTSKPHGSLLAGLALFAWLAPGTAGAGIEVYTPVDVGGFVANSSDSDPVFQAAAEATANAMDLDVTHLTFEFEANGTPLPVLESKVPGTIFSERVSFRSPDADSSDPVNVPENIVRVGNAPGVAYRIGALPNYKGALEVDFASAAGAVNLVGLGIVDLDPGATIQIFDADDAALTTYTLPADVARFAFVGFEATEGDQIGRLLIEQSGELPKSYALQDIEFVPEPCAGLLQFAALATLVGLARTRLRAIHR
jgi:hypothetical protein